MISAPDREIHVQYDIDAPMRDGTILRSTIYRPARPGRYPVLPSRTRTAAMWAPIRCTSIRCGWPGTATSSCSRTSAAGTAPKGVQVPALHIGGWFDVFRPSTLGQYRATAALAAQCGATPPRLLIGPWTHVSVAGATGQLDFGPAAALDLTEQHLRWYDATLKGQLDRLAGDPVQLFVMGENRWRRFPAYPVPGTRAVDWHLQPDGGLDRRVAPPSPPDTYAHDPTAETAHFTDARSFDSETRIGDHHDH
jgi:uncharacterized protein